MIDLHFFPTPNGHKISIMLEEVGLPYRVSVVDILKGQQFEPEFLAISPNNKIPAIVDPDGPGGAPISIFESGAILIYLAQKTGQLLPSVSTDPAGHYRTLEWLIFQMAGVGPMLGQAHHFRIYAPEKIAYGIERYTKEAQRLYGVADRALSERAFLAGETLSIADIASYPWMRLHERQGVELESLPHVTRWLETMAARPAVARGLAVTAEVDPSEIDTEEAKKNLFGDKQHGR